MKLQLFVQVLVELLPPEPYLDLIADGATVPETTAAIGGAPKSKIIFAWLADSEAAGEFDPPPEPDSKWCIEWRGKLEWFWRLASDPRRLATRYALCALVFFRLVLRGAGAADRNALIGAARVAHRHEH